MHQRDAGHLVYRNPKPARTTVTSRFHIIEPLGLNGGTFTELRIGTYVQPFTTFAFQGVNGNAAEIAKLLATVNSADL